MLPMAEWPEWAPRTGLAETVLADDPQVDGHFEWVAGSGELHRAPHHTVGQRITLLSGAGLRLRNSHLLISPQGEALLPHPWHLQIGEYPYRDPSVLTRGRLGAALARPARWQRVTEPVALLANMDAVFHRNFYHWVVQALTRA